MRVAVVQYSNQSRGSVIVGQPYAVTKNVHGGYVLALDHILQDSEPPDGGFVHSISIPFHNVRRIIPL